MRFIPTPLTGSYLVEPELISDERGFFARTWCQNVFESKGLNPNLVQCNISYNKVCGTLRGMHYQKAPHAEAKLIKCIQGAIYDVIIDIRTESTTFMQWLSVELTAANRKSLYVPEGFAHGFITLMNDTEVLYQMSEFFDAECAAGIRWDDPVFKILWPVEMTIISERDKRYANFEVPQ